MPTVAQLRRWSPETLREAASLVGVRAAAVEGVATRVQDPDGTWRGEAAEAARARATAVRAVLRDRVAELSGLARALRAAASRADQVVLDLRAIESSLRDARFELTGDGMVLDLGSTDPAVTAHWSPTERAEQQRRACSDVQALLALAGSVDSCLSAALRGVGEGGLTVDAARVASPPGAADADMRVRARQAVGVVSEQIAKWGHGPVPEQARRRYEQDEAFATLADDYADHNDAGMLARDVLLATQDEPLARWTYEHPYEWAHPAPADSPDGTGYAMDIPVEHSPRIEWARAATAVSNGYLQVMRPGKPERTLVQEAEAVKRNADAFFTGPMNESFAKVEETAQEIARGHSYDKHVLGLDRRGRPRFTPDMPELGSRAELARKTANTAWTRARVSLTRGRAYHLDPADSHIVIIDPSAADLGTSFRITRPGYEQGLLVRAAEEADGQVVAKVTLPGSTMETRYLSRNEVWVDYERAHHIPTTHQAVTHVVASYTGQIGTGGYVP